MTETQVKTTAFSKLRSLSWNLTISLVLVVATVSILTTLLSYEFLSRRSEALHQQRAKEYITFLQESLELPLWKMDNDTVERTCRSFTKNEVVSYLKITNEHGQLLFMEEDKTDGDLLIKTATLSYANQKIGHIELGLSPRVYQEANTRLLMVSIFTMLVVIIGVAIATEMASRVLLRNPLDLLIQRIRDIAAGQHKDMRQQSNTREIAAILTEFSGMAERVKEREQSLVRINQELEGQISERKKAEGELLKTKAYITNIINSMPSTLISVDADCKITQWNCEAERVTGRLAKDAVGQPLSEAFARLTSEIERVQEAMRSREVRSDLRKAHKENGETKYEDVTVYPLVTNGVEGAVIRVDDVTERVRIEEMMVQSEKMLSIGGLAAGMAHEINNPLGGMMQNASVMSDRLTNVSLPANTRAAENAGTSMSTIQSFMESRGIPKMLSRIQTSGHRAAEIVANMLSFARKSNNTDASFNIVDLLDRSVDLAGSDYDLMKKFDFRQIKIIRKHQENIPNVPCESGQIQQVFINILRNGAEAMQEIKSDDLPAEPTFTLRVSHEKTLNMVRIEIENNGPAIDEATRKRIFEPFFTTKPINCGTGLGLSVSYFIITETHAGEMYAESDSAKTTNFVIRLPLNRKKGN